MKSKLLAFALKSSFTWKIAFVLFFLTMQSYGQSIFMNNIDDNYPSSVKPFTFGQIVDPNITVSGIGYGPGLNSNTGKDRYNLRDWNLVALDPSDYFEFTISPKSGYKINFTSFTYTGQSSGAGPTMFQFSSSLDGYSSAIGTAIVDGTTLNLSASPFQNISSSITFRFYGWGGGATTGTYSINDFNFTGTVVCATTPTFTQQPASDLCINSSPRYTTQSGKSNYVWTVPGVLGTDYTITSGGISSTNSTVNIKWLTPGTKTVTVNYTDNCAGPTAASSTTTVIPNSSVSSVTGPSRICIGEPTQYTANGVEIGNGTVTWTSSNDSVATVDITGIVTAKSSGYTLLTYAIADGCGGNKTVNKGINVDVATVGGNMTGGTTICSGQNSPILTLKDYVGTILKWQSSTDSFATTTDIVQSTPTNSSLAPTQTTQYRAVVQSGNCHIAYSTPTTVTVNIPATPIVGTVVQPTCIAPTGSIELKGLPSSGTITQSGTDPHSFAITGTTMIISLAAGTYNFAVNDSFCTSVQTGNIVLNSITTNTYTGTWSTGAEPTLNQNVIINADYTENKDIDACRCTIYSGKKVTIQEGKTMKLQNEVVVIGTGTLTFLESASLVQINDAAPNSGSITYKRNTTEITNFDYTYWSSPVQGQVLGILSPDTFYDKFYSFNAAGNAWKLENRANTMEVGRGYIIRGPETFKLPASPGFFTASFYGAPNNGVINMTIGGVDSINLIGNPYPSAIDANLFLTQNSGVIDGTIYFWTHNTAIQLASNIEAGKAGSGTLAYTSDDYASYNFTGGTATAKTAISTSGASAGKAPNGKIAAGQSFLAIGKSSTNVVFNNSMRLKSDLTTKTNYQFFKPAASSKPAKSTTLITEQNRLWLNLSNEQGAFKQLLIGYVTGATNDFDAAYDGYTFNANSYINFYSINNKNSYSIQGRAVDTQKYDIVPLGYSSTIEGPFSISIDQMDGTLSDQEIILEDKITLSKHNLQLGAYSFTTAVGTFDDRFVISYKTKSSLATIDFEANDNLIYVTQTIDTIDLYSQSELLSEVALYDISGKLLSKKTAIGSKEVSFTKISKPAQVVLFKIKLENGQTISKKVGLN